MFVNKVDGHHRAVPVGPRSARRRMADEPARFAVGRSSRRGSRPRPPCGPQVLSRRTRPTPDEQDRAQPTPFAGARLRMMNPGEIRITEETRSPGR
jgi:hypothetical protein